MIEKDIRGGICHVIQRYAKANKKYMKNYDNSMESLRLEYLDAHDLYGWEMSKTLPVNVFKWVKKLLEFNEDFKKNMMRTVTRDTFLKKTLSKKFKTSQKFV